MSNHERLPVTQIPGAPQGYARLLLHGGYILGPFPPTCDYIANAGDGPFVPLWLDEADARREAAFVSEAPPLTSLEPFELRLWLNSLALQEHATVGLWLPGAGGFQLFGGPGVMADLLEELADTFPELSDRALPAAQADEVLRALEAKDFFGPEPDLN
jgi:hypothetical protein